MADHLISVPFAYTAHLKPKRARVDRDVRIRDEAMVMLRDVAGHDAPVSIRLDGLSFPSRAPRQVTYRHHDGRCYRPLRPAGLDTGPVDVERFKGLLAAMGDGALATWADHPWERSTLAARAGCRMSDALPLSSYAGAERRFDTLEDARREAVLVVEDLIVIDGVVWLATPEPVIAVEMQALSKRAGLLPTVHRQVVPADMNHAWFRADRTAAAASFAIGSGFDPQLIDSLNVIRPDLLRFDERYGAASRLLNAMDHVAWLGRHREWLQSIVGAHRDDRVFPGVEAFRLIEEVWDELRALAYPSSDRLSVVVASIRASEKHFAPLSETGGIIDNSDLEALDL